MIIPHIVTPKLINTYVVTTKTTNTKGNHQHPSTVCDNLSENGFKNLPFVLNDMCVQMFMRGLFQGRLRATTRGNRTGAGGVKIVTTRADVCCYAL